MGYRNERCVFLMDYITFICRFWGIVTAICLWGIGADVTFHKHALGFYILACAVLLTFLETTWVADLFINLCIRDENPFLRCWACVTWLDLWRKSVVYTTMAALMFLHPHRLWLAAAGGGALLVLAVLYLICTYKVKLETRDRLLGSKDTTYDRFEDIQDDLDDSIPEPEGRADNVGAQEEILESEIYSSSDLQTEMLPVYILLRSMGIFLIRFLKQILMHCLMI